MLRLTASKSRNIPEWSGFMRIITKGNPLPSEKHIIEFLPFVDMDPNNLSTIHTTLMFVIDQCKIQKTSPVISFNQPLWLKSMKIKKIKIWT